MEVDEALGKLGKFGKWQSLLYVLVSIVATWPGSWHMMAIVFIGAVPPHRCVLSDGLTEADIPEEINTERQLVNSSCNVYVNITYDNVTEPCPNGWDYNEDFGSTIVTEWDLVCTKKLLSDTSQTVMVIGVMVGAMVFSVMSDMVGRKPALLVASWGMVVVGTITSFVHNYYFFCVMRFLAGVCQQGLILPGFVLACELYSAQYRTFAGIFIENFWAVGMCLLALFAYLIRNWRYLQLFMSLLGLFTISLYWVLPESIPWLVANNRTREAEEILRKAAKMNGVVMPDKILVHAEEEEKIMDEKDSGSTKKKSVKDKIVDGCRHVGRTCLNPCKRKPKKKEDSSNQYTLLDVFRNRRLAINAIIMCFLWFVNNLVYYGLSLSTGVTAGDRYINFFLSGLVEIPAYTSTIFILAKWGRRWPLCIYHCIAGVFLILSMLVPEKTPSGVNLVPLIMTFNMIAKFGITGSFGIIFLYAPELFPTTVRNQAMGVASVGGRLGNMLAPFAATVGRILPFLPGLLFGCLSVGVGLLALLLPETLGRPLPQTIEEINSWTRTIPDKAKYKKSKPELVEVGNDVKDAKNQDSI